MAIFHFKATPVRRSLGHSVTAAAAYISRGRIVDERTGEIHNYTSKADELVSADLVLPAGAGAWAKDRAALWSAAELAEKRKDACTGRAIVLALPNELDAEARRELALSFARSMVQAEGCAVDVAIHLPDAGGDSRNHHAHLLRTTRRVGANGMGAKLDSEQAGRGRRDDLNALRERWAAFTNAALERAGQGARIDHRSNEARGLDAVATVHVGHGRDADERRAHNAEIRALNHTLASARAELAELEAKPAKQPAISLRELAAAVEHREAVARMKAEADAKAKDEAAPKAKPKTAVDQDELMRFRRALKAADLVKQTEAAKQPDPPPPPPPEDEDSPDGAAKKWRPR